MPIDGNALCNGRAPVRKAIYFGNTHWMENAGDNTTLGPDGKPLDGPWVGADLEAGMYALTAHTLTATPTHGRCPRTCLPGTTAGASTPSTTRRTSRSPSHLCRFTCAVRWMALH